MSPRRTWRHLMAAMGAILGLVLVGLPAGAASPLPPWTAGADRYATSVEISRQAFPDGASTVFLARGDSFPDALAAGAAAASNAGAQGAPVLLTRRDEIPPVVLNEIKRLAPSTTVILGGTSAISQGVELEVATVSTLIRLDGPNRYATAVRLAEWAFDKGPHVVAPRTVHLASGVDFPDALGGGVAAALGDGTLGAPGGPLLLTEPGVLTAETAAYLQRLRPDRIVLLGGEAAISPAVATRAEAIAPVTRLSGPDRYVTSAVISQRPFETAGTVFLADGNNFPDALAGTPLAVRHRGPILLTQRGTLDPAVCAEIKRLGPASIVALGGPQAVPLQARAAAQNCAGIIAGPPSLTPAPEPTIGPPSPAPASRP